MAIDVDELATALRDAMPRSSEVVDRYHRFGESELAIPAALTVFAQENVPLPADGLGGLLSDPIPDPFAVELVLASGARHGAVAEPAPLPRAGSRRRRRRVCAGVAFRSPASLIAEITGTTDDDPWSPEAMTWPLIEAIDASCAESWCRTLATHLGHFAANDDAVTRAKEKVRVVRIESSVRAAVQRRAVRASGLGRRLRASLDPTTDGRAVLRFSRWSRRRSQR